jgi:hypothetical protein
MTFHLRLFWTLVGLGERSALFFNQLDEKGRPIIGAKLKALCQFGSIDEDVRMLSFVAEDGWGEFQSDRFEEVQDEEVLQLLLFLENWHRLKLLELSLPVWIVLTVRNHLRIALSLLDDPLPDTFTFHKFLH